MFVRKIFILLSLLALGGTAIAETVAVKPDHPDRYVVVKGDTLWDISSRFLKSPWEWPKVWKNNPQIKNPHLIYPGDAISLVYVNGQPQLRLERAPVQHERVIKLSPHARKSPLDREAIATIPANLINPFLTRTRVISQRELDTSGYIISPEEGRLISGIDDLVYARDITPEDTARYLVFRTGESYYHPDDDENPIGYEALYVGEAELKKIGDPSTFVITEASREILLGDRMLPIFPEPITNEYVPHAPDFPVSGNIISVVDGVSRIGQYQIIVINIGEADGIEPGHTLEISQSGITVRDTIDTDKDDAILPEERAGIAMVFRSFENVSYAIILEATREIRLYDKVATP